MMRRFLLGWYREISPPVFIGAAVLNTAIILFGALWTETAGRAFVATLEFITAHFGWYYVLSVTGFLGFVIWLLFSPYGNIRLGRPDSKPEFSRFAWFTMLFAAGMGMGLVFWGVAEPLSHYTDPPKAEPETPAAVAEAMRFSFFHWGFHPWAIYIIFALGIAFYHFRHDLPLAPRSLLYPLFGERIHGWIGHATDAFCTVGTLLGVATSLGLGAMQINSGLNVLGGVAVNTEVQIWIILAITAVATTSTASGVGRGIKYLSLTNICLMLVLLLFVFLVGPTLFQIKVFVGTLGDYLQNLVQTSLWMDLRESSDWQARWTLFYWGWWVSWCPFVGIFIARVSEGRTIREFVLWVFLLPTLVNFAWFAVFGGTAMHVELYGAGGLAEQMKGHVEVSLNAMLAHLPWATGLQWMGMILVIIFFITSSDSGSFVDDMVTSGGNPHPPTANRIFWGVSEGAAAAILLLAGGLKALQAASIAGGLPQSVLVIVACVGLARALRQDAKVNGVPETSKLTES